jgi:hypothetical protein
MINLSLDTLFTAINNRNWHSIKELSTQLAIPTYKLEELARFLSNNGLVKYREKNGTIKIQPKWSFLLPTEEILKTPKPIMAHFVIPPHVSIDIQSTHITNLGKVELEVTLRIDNKIREVAIEA